MRSHRCQQRHHSECTLPPGFGLPMECACKCHKAEQKPYDSQTAMENVKALLGEDDSDWWDLKKPAKAGKGTVTVGTGKCPGHYKPTLIWESPFPVYAGSSKAEPTPGATFIDLADLARPLIQTAGLEWGYSHSPRIAIRWPDMSAPALTKQDWQDIADNLEQDNKPVYVSCNAGHGRTGTTLAILGCLLGAIPEGCPVTWLRKGYCDDEVETQSQMDYVAKITGREVKAKPHYSSSSFSYTPPEPWIEGTPLSECKYAPEHQGCDRLGHVPKPKPKGQSTTAATVVNLNSAVAGATSTKPDKIELAKSGTGPVQGTFSTRCPLCNAYCGHFKNCKLANPLTLPAAPPMA